MPHSISWPVPDHVVMLHLMGEIMADEVQIAADELYHSIDTSAASGMVHMLINAQEAAIQDKIWNYAKLKFRRHEKAYLVVVIGDSRLSGLIIAIFSKILNIHIHYSESIEAAVKTIAERDLAVADYLNQ